MTVGEVAKLCGLSVSTLHFYERKGLLAPVRTEGNQRRYGYGCTHRVSLIRIAQACGMTLEETSQLLGPDDPEKPISLAAWRQALRTCEQRLHKQRSFLKALNEAIAPSLRCNCRSLEHCSRCGSQLQMLPEQPST